MSKTLIIDIRVNNYQGNPTRLIATCDSLSGRIYISAEKPYNPPKKDKTAAERLKEIILNERRVVVTDSPNTLANWDIAFNEREHLEQAIKAYHDKHKNGLLKMADSVMRYRPDGVLQQRKLDVVAGSVWELSAETENGNICILLACWCAAKLISNDISAEIINEPDPTYQQSDSDDFDAPFCL